jgi:HPt (histidine-containing phosphotransfer) domain-containing protein
MTFLRLLLVETDAVRSQRIADALSVAKFNVLPVSSLDEAQEALGIQQFDIVLVSSRQRCAEQAQELSPLLKQLSQPTPLFVYGPCEARWCSAAISPDVPESVLGAEIIRLQQAAAKNQEYLDSNLTMFDLLAFQNQMGDDPELMEEIIGIFFAESVEQLQELRSAVAAGEYHRASRLAHSLKGSLGALHAYRAQHWAQALELAAGKNDSTGSERCLAALEQTISALTPQLQSVLTR